MASSTLLAYLVTFTASFLIMVIELVAGRILAPYIGQHLYSWTSIIGVCLAGISLGAWLGGWLADRFPRRGTLGWILLAAGVLALLIPLVTDTVGGNQYLDYRFSLMWRIVIYTTLIFLPASLALGMVSPTVIRLVVIDVERTGSVVGRIYAFSTLGSILGTFATGFFLIEAFGTRLLLYAVGAILVVIAPLVGGLFGRLGGRVVAAVLGLCLVSAVTYYVARPAAYADHLAWVKEKIGRPVGVTTYKVADLGMKVEPVAGGLRVASIPPKKNTKPGVEDLLDEELVRLGLVPGPLAVGDVLTEIEGRPADAELVKKVIADGYVDQPLRVKFLRDGKSQETTTRLQAREKYKLFYPYADYAYVEETNYYTLRIDHEAEDRRTVNNLILDNLVHSHSDVDDPTYLAYEYLQIYEELVGWKLSHRSTTANRQFFIGGGGYTMQRLFNFKYKDCHIDVAEIDPRVTNVAQEWLKAPKDDPRLVTINQDARLVVLDKYRAGEKYDFIFGDAFNDLSIPFHLTTLEFDNQLKSLLTDDGLVMSLVIDHVGQGHFLPSFLATMRAAFGDDNVALILATKPEFRKSLIDHVKAVGLGDFVARLELHKLDELAPEMREKLMADQGKRTADELVTDAQKEKLKLLPEDRREKWKTSLAAEAREKRVQAILDELDRRKMDDLTPYLKPAELDHITHSTVIVVASKTKQNWGDFQKYLDELDNANAKDDPERTRASHIITPAEVTTYLKTRTRAATWFDRLLRRVDKEEILPWEPVVLTDDYAPVDNLTAPMFEKRYGYNKRKAEEQRRKEGR